MASEVFYKLKMSILISKKLRYILCQLESIYELQVIFFIGETMTKR